MTTVEKLYDLYRRATKPEEERPVLLPFGEDTTTVGQASAELREALYALSVATKALEFYGNPDNHKPVELPTSVSEDGGKLAQYALSVIVNA